MTIVEIILLFQVVIGSASSPGSSASVTVAADCASEITTIWNTSIPNSDGAPYGVSAASTQTGDACTGSSALDYTIALPD